MKAWPLLLLGIGACADPPRRPPTTYVPLVRSPETPSLPGPDGPVPLGADPSSGPSAASSKAASNDKPEKPEKPTPGNDPVNDTRCFKKLAGECCAEPGVPRVTKNGKTSCPSGMILGAKCKGIGKSCHP
jgi:hypothetical protein